MMTEASPGDAPTDAPVATTVATTADDANALPFVAPCRRLGTWEPIGWLRLAWGDFKTAPRQSLTYGAVVVLLSWALAYIAIRFGGYFELLALVSGFILVAPLLAVGTYSISDQIERGLKPSLRRCFIEERRAFGNLMVFALILMIVFLVWWRAASAVHIFFPVDMTTPDWTDYLQFLGIGSVIGSIFATIVFSAAAFSLPMLVDRETDAVTAVVTSINAVLRNKPAMAVWAAHDRARRGTGICDAVDRTGAGRRVCARDGPARHHVAPDRARDVARLPRDDRRIGLAEERAPRPVSRAALVPASGTTQGRSDPGS